MNVLGNLEVKVYRKLDLVRWGLLDSKIEDMKKAMLYMMDGTKTVQIFDKLITQVIFRKYYIILMKEAI